MPWPTAAPRGREYDPPVPRHVAFLRAINVGGRRASRDQLTSCLESLGFENVTTFRASGNLIFDASRQPETALTRRIDDALTQSLGYDVRAFLRTAGDVHAIAAHVCSRRRSSTPPAASSRWRSSEVTAEVRPRRGPLHGHRR